MEGSGVQMGCANMMQPLSIIMQVGRVIPPRLVAVSKNQSVEKVQWAYQEGLRHFGENYVSAGVC